MIQRVLLLFGVIGIVSCFPAANENVFPEPNQMEDIVLKPTEAFERPEARIEDIVPKPTRHFEKPEVAVFMFRFGG
ncbi:uncharacterized protein LOC144421034 isoform X6 [Styela clava]